MSETSEATQARGKVTLPPGEATWNALDELVASRTIGDDRDRANLEAGRLKQAPEARGAP